MLKLPLDLKGRFEASFDGSWKWFFFIGGISVDNLLIHHDYFEFQNWTGRPDVLHKSEIKSLGFVSGQKIFRLRFNHTCKVKGFPSSLVFTAHHQTLSGDNLKLLFEHLGYIVQPYV